MGNFIKIFDEKTAQELIKGGFSYVTEHCNKQTVYAFTATDELLQFINSLYDCKGIIQEGKLRF